MTLLPGTIEAFGLYLVRTSALVLFAPLYGTGSSFSGYKIALVLAVAFVLFAAHGAPLPPAEPVVYAAMAVRELVIGLFLAFLLHAVLLAIRVAGEMVGNEMGFGMAATIDPATGARVPVLSQVYEILFLLALLGVDGHHWLLRALADSLARAPVGRIAIATGIAGTATKLVSELFAAGIAFAAPVFVLLVLVSLLVAFLARTVPQLNVMEFGFNVRIGVALLGMLAFAPVLAPAMSRLLDHLMGGIDLALDAVQG